jgi:hypothetical protein
VFLAQLRNDGYSIFVVRGALPEPMRDSSMGKREDWHPLENLLPSATTTSNKRRSPPDDVMHGRVDANLVQYRVFDSIVLQEEEALSLAIAASLAAVAPPPAPSVDGRTSDVTAAPAHSGEQYDEDIELALALSMSNEPKPVVSSDPETVAIPPEPAPHVVGVANVKVRLPPRKCVTVGSVSGW